MLVIPDIEVMNFGWMFLQIGLIWLVPLMLMSAIQFFRAST